MRKLPMMVALALFIAVSYIGAVHADTELIACGTVISLSGDYYLNSSIIATGYDDVCIDVASNDVNIDCKGNTIDSLNIDTYGIRITSNNFNVSNCIVNNFTGVGISLEAGNNMRVTNNTVNNAVIGISNNNYDTLIENNSIFGTTYALNNALNGTIRNNYYSGNVYDYNQGASTYSSSIYNNAFMDGIGSIITAGIYNDWNTTVQNGSRIVGGGMVGGNYWGACSDLNSNGFCDTPVTMDGSNIDYLPLSSSFIPPYIPDSPFLVYACKTLSKSGYYTLMQDVNGIDGYNCFDIGAEIGVTLDCNGHEINGGNFTIGGVYDWAGYSLTKNCIFNDFNSGAWTTEGAYSTFLNNTIKHSYGASPYPASFVVIENNTFKSNALSGIRLPTSYNVVKGNVFEPSVYPPIELLASGNLIYNNKFDTLAPMYFYDGETEDWNVSADSIRNVLGYNAFGGNYWGSCTDANKDGYCDSTHVINGVNSDNLALSNNYIFGYGHMPPITDMNLISTTYQCSGDVLITGMVYGFCINESCGTTEIDVPVTCPYGCYSGDSPNYCTPSPNQVSIYFVIIIIIMIAAAAVVAKKLA